jgi:hypothetical protein
MNKQCPTDQFVPNCSHQSLSTCALDIEGDGIPPVDDASSSDGIISADGTSSNDSLFISFDNDVVVLGRRNEFGVKPRDAE